MLEFVHLTGAEAGKDLQTRRKVRSQAMRHYRARQRKEKEAATKPTPKKAPKSPRSPQNSTVDTSSQQGSPQPQVRSRAASTTSNTSRAASITSNTSQQNLSFEYETTDGLLSVPHLHTAPPNFYSDYSFDDVPQSSYFPPQQNEQSSFAETTYLTPDWMVHHSQPVARSESSWGSETDDVYQGFQAPAQICPILTFCQSCGAATAYPVLCEPCTSLGLFERSLTGSWT